MFWFGILAIIFLIIFVFDWFRRSHGGFNHGRIGRNEFAESGNRKQPYGDNGYIERKPPTSETKIRTALHEELWAATERAREAEEALIAITGESASAMIHPHGVPRIRDASRKVSLTRAQLIRAHKRVQDYLRLGIVPDDLSGATDSLPGAIDHAERLPPRRSVGPNRPAQVRSFR